jgi:hypothetical protein
MCSRWVFRWGCDLLLAFQTILSPLLQWLVLQMDMKTTLAQAESACDFFWHSWERERGAFC